MSQRRSSGLSIGRALRIPAGVIHDDLRDVVAAIDRVHSVSELPAIPFSMVRFTRSATTRWRRRGSFGFTAEGTPTGIFVDSTRTQRRLTAVHEVGHFLDLCAIGEDGRFESAEDGGALADWLDAASETRSVHDLREILHAGSPPWNDLAADYLEWPEIWARSYAQFIARRSGDPRLLADLADFRAPVVGGVYFPAQWDEDDFIGIEHAIDDLLRRLGW